MKTTLKFKLIFSALLLFIVTTLASAQQTAEEWLEDAATAEAEGRTQDAASAYSGAAHEQMKDGDYEAAGENFKKAAEGYRKVGKEAQANAEAKNAGNAYEKAADEASNDGDHERAAELYEKAAEQYDAAGLADDAFKMRGNAKYERQLAEYASGGNPEVSVKPTGTGRTIGNIANISVTNNNPFPVSTVAQDVYIPANEGTQDYVGRIPEGIVIPPNETVSVPVDGICVDPTTPPVGPGEPMSDISSWVHVGGSGDTPPSIGEPQIPDEMNPASVPMPHTGTVPVVLVTNPPVLEFDPTDIPDIVTSKGFNPSATPGDIIVTWPGTVIPVGGTFNPKTDPRTYARVIVDAVERVEKAAEVIHNSGDFPTPFTSDPSREIEAFIQQQVWIFSAIVTGSKYEKEDFAKNVYDQFTGNTGVAVTTLPKERKDDLESGIDDFWNAFQAVGVEAKVISAQSPGLDLSDPAMSDLVQAQRADPPPACGCDSLTFVVARDFGGLNNNPSKQKATKFSSSKSSPHRVTIELDEEDFKKETKISVSGITVYCSNCSETPCHPYAREKEGGNDEMVEARKGKVLISDVVVTGAKEAVDDRSTDGQGVSVTVTPDKGTTNYIITFKVGATCMAAGCAEKSCFKYISIEVKQKAKKK